MIAGFFVLRKQAKHSKIRSIKWSKSRVSTLQLKRLVANYILSIWEDFKKTRFTTNKKAPQIGEALNVFTTE